MISTVQVLRSENSTGTHSVLQSLGTGAFFGGKTMMSRWVKIWLAQMTRHTQLTQGSLKVAFDGGGRDAREIFGPQPEGLLPADLDAPRLRLGGISTQSPVPLHNKVLQDRAGWTAQLNTIRFFGSWEPIRALIRLVQVVNSLDGRVTFSTFVDVRQHRQMRACTHNSSMQTCFFQCVCCRQGEDWMCAAGNGTCAD